MSASGATRLGLLISAVGASIFLQNAVMFIAGAREKVYMTYAVFPRAWRFTVAGVSVSVLVVVIASIAVVMMIGSTARQRTGLAARSVRWQDREMAAVMGIDVALIGADVLHRVRSRWRGGRADRVLLYAGGFHMGYAGTEGIHRGVAAVPAMRGAMLGRIDSRVVESMAVIHQSAFKVATSHGHHRCSLPARRPARLRHC